jgi:hypothetical protein
MPDYSMFAVNDRIGHPERESTVDHLNHAFTHGYLDKEELDKRVHKAFEAVIMGDLRTLVRDLPRMPDPKSHVRLRHPVQTYKSLTDGGKALVWVGGVILSALWLVFGCVIADATHPAHHLGLSGALEFAAALTVGIPALFSSGIRALWVAIEGTD